MTTEDIDARIVSAAGRYFFVKSLPGSAWATLAIMVAELESRTGAEQSGRYDALLTLRRGAELLALKPADFGA
jgi:hypothetical protein